MEFQKLFILGIFLLIAFEGRGEPLPTVSKQKKSHLIEIENNKNTEKPLEPSQPPQDLTQVSSADSLSFAPKKFFFSDTQSVTLYTGGIYSVNSTSSVFYGMFGLEYMWPSERLFHLETAFDISVNQESHFRVMGRWNIHSTEKFRPYFNAGLGLRVLPQDNIGVILSWGRLIAQIGYGFDWSLKQNISLKMEAFAGADQNQNTFFALLTGPVCSF